MRRQLSPFLWWLGLALFTAFIMAGCNGLRQENATPSSPVLKRGAELYAANCASCHGGPKGGKIDDYPPRHNANGHTWHHPDCQITSIVLDGFSTTNEMMRRMMGVPEDAPRMPAFRERLTEEDVAAILAYIKTWWTNDQREWQAMVTQMHC